MQQYDWWEKHINIDFRCLMPNKARSPVYYNLLNSYYPLIMQRAVYLAKKAWGFFVDKTKPITKRIKRIYRYAFPPKPIQPSYKYWKATSIKHIGHKQWIQSKKNENKRLKDHKMQQEQQSSQKYEQDIDQLHKKFAQYLRNPQSQPIHQELTCPICLQILIEPSMTPCGHTFCFSCLDDVLSFGNACPSCRSVIRGMEITTCRMLDDLIQAKIKQFAANPTAYKHYLNRLKLHREWREKRQVAIQSIKVGMKLDVRDTQSIWCQATVRQLIYEGDRLTGILVHFEKWNKIYDEIIELPTCRIAKSQFYSSRKQIPQYSLHSDQDNLRGAVVTGRQLQEMQQRDRRRRDSERLQLLLGLVSSRDQGNRPLHNLEQSLLDLNSPIINVESDDQADNNDNDNEIIEEQPEQYSQEQSSFRWPGVAVLPGQNVNPAPNNVAISISDEQSEQMLVGQLNPSRRNSLSFMNQQPINVDNEIVSQSEEENENNQEPIPISLEVSNANQPRGQGLRYQSSSSEDQQEENDLRQRKELQKRMADQIAVYQRQIARYQQQIAQCNQQIVACQESIGDREPPLQEMYKLEELKSKRQLLKYTLEQQKIKLQELKLKLVLYRLRAGQEVMRAAQESIRVGQEVNRVQEEVNRFEQVINRVEQEMIRVEQEVNRVQQIINRVEQEMIRAEEEVNTYEANKTEQEVIRVPQEVIRAEKQRQYFEQLQIRAQRQQLSRQADQIGQHQQQGQPPLHEQLQSFIQRIRGIRGIQSLREQPNEN